jgi:hypothetical protein
MRSCSVIALTLLIIGGAAARAEPAASDPPAVTQDAAPPAETRAPEGPAAQSPDKEGPSDVRESICLMVEAAAKANDLPLEFFARVIWQESRFNADAIGPRTRSGDKAQGIAQFMPRTAAERGLLDPFDPVQALPKSAEFLSELRNQFGNLGLAAAAYNAGPRRVQEWLSGTGSMPLETRHYVVAITGTTVEEWGATSRGGKTSGGTAHTTCQALMALLKRTPNDFVTELEQRVKVGADRPWGVQLAAGFGREMAMAMYSRAIARLRGVFGDQDPMLLGGLFRSRGTRTFYQVRIGTETRREADDLCIRIRHAGGACLVLRNARG